MGKDNFVATDGWFHRWKKRENIVFKRTHGELKDADFTGAENWINNEWPKISSEYPPCNVYNADETGIYYRALPQHTYLFKNEDAKGCKTSKERITALCCVNMSGNKKQLLVIGKTKSPRSFKGINNLPVEYYANSNAWMTAAIFKEWLIKWDNVLDHNIVLLVDNCTAHNNVSVLLKNIKVVYLPANTTALIQPCDQGIIRTLKAYYRREMRSRLLSDMEENQAITANQLAKKTTLLDALHLLAMSWNQVSENTIKNCFKRGGFIKEGVIVEECLEENMQPPDMMKDEYDDWMAIDEHVAVSAKLTEEDVCEAVASTSKATQEEADEDDGDVCEEILPVRTNKEVRQALEILRQYVQKKAEDFQKHYEYERFINDLLIKDSRQSTIDEFFKN